MRTECGYKGYQPVSFHLLLPSSNPHPIFSPFPFPFCGHPHLTTLELDQYWNWGRYAQDPINSPLFNGDEYSLGGNGAKSAYSGIPIGMTGGIPAAEGGGCVTTGPFKK